MLFVMDNINSNLSNTGRINIPLELNELVSALNWNNT